MINLTQIEKTLLSQYIQFDDCKLSHNLQPEDFQHIEHQQIFERTKQLREEGIQPTELLVSSCGASASYLASITSESFSSRGFAEYELQVLKASYARKMENRVKNILADKDMDYQDRLNAIRKEVNDNYDIKMESELVLADEGIQDALTRMEENMDETKPRIETGIEPLDRVIGGFNSGTLNIVAGRSGEGKSAFALGVALKAVKKNIPTFFVSLEMGHEDIYFRWLGVDNEINSSKIHSGRLDQQEINKAINGLTEKTKYPLYFNKLQPNVKMTLSEIERKLSQIKQVGLLIVDYLQMVPADEKLSREQQVSSVARGLKNISLQHNIPVIALSQMNRALDIGADRKPVLADLRESGEIAQAADKVLFVYNPSKNDPTKSVNDVEIVVAKNRTGMAGVVPVYWEPIYTRFKEKGDAWDL